MSIAIHHMVKKRVPLSTFEFNVETSVCCHCLKNVMYSNDIKLEDFFSIKWPSYEFVIVLFLSS